MLGKRVANLKGTTLVEMMIVVAILGAIALIGPDLYKQVRRFFFLSNARVELQREARNVMSILTRRIRQAQSASLSIDRVTNQPYYSRISFSDIDGNNVSYYQSGKDLNMVVGNSTSTLTSNLRYIAFALPRSDDMGILSMAITLERGIFEGRTKALHMASEKVRIMN